MRPEIKEARKEAKYIVSKFPEMTIETIKEVGFYHGSGECTAGQCGYPREWPGRLCFAMYRDVLLIRELKRKGFLNGKT